MRVVWHYFYRPQDHYRILFTQVRNLAYKDRVRKKRIQEFHLKHDAELKPNSEKEFLTPTEVAAFLGVGRTSIYRYIKTRKSKRSDLMGKLLYGVRILIRCSTTLLLPIMRISPKRKLQYQISTPQLKSRKSMA